MIDLQQFCSTDRMRPYLHNPFTIGGFTYATNGHVCVRVAPIDGVAKQDKPDPGKLFTQYFKDEPRGALEVAMPEIVEDWQECGYCGGSGKEHDCPDCTCGECTDCDGKGKIKESLTVTISIGNATYDGKYVKQLLDLPGLRFPVSPPKEGAAGFVFAGGEGLLMPLRWDDVTDAAATITP